MSIINNVNNCCNKNIYHYSYYRKHFSFKSPSEIIRMKKRRFSVFSFIFSGLNSQLKFTEELLKKNRRIFCNPDKPNYFLQGVKPCRKFNARPFIIAASYKVFWKWLDKIKSSNNWENLGRVACPLFLYF